MNPFFSILKSERVFKAIDMDHIVIVFKISIKERNKVFFLALLIDLNMVSSIKYVSFNLTCLLHSLEPNCVILVKLSFFVRNNISFQIVFLEELRFSWVYNFVVSEHNKHNSIHGHESLFINVHQLMGLLVVQKWKKSRVVYVPAVSQFIVSLPVVLRWCYDVLNQRIVHKRLCDIVQEITPPSGETVRNFFNALVRASHWEVVVNFVLAKIAMLNYILRNNIALAFSDKIEIWLSKNRMVSDLLAVLITLLYHFSENWNIFCSMRSCNIKALCINSGISKIIRNLYCLRD